MINLQLDVVRDDVEFAALRDEWNALVAVSGVNHVFLTWEWLYTWWRHVPEGARLHVVTIRANGELVAAAPCLVQPRTLRNFTLVPTLRWLGTGEAGSDYLDVLVAPSAAPEALALMGAYLSQQGYVLDLPALPEGSNARLLGGALEQRGWSLARQSADVCPFIPLSGRSWDDYLQGLGSEHRYNFRRRLRRLEQDHGLRFETVRTEAERASAMETLIDLHNKRWAPRGGSTAFNSARLLAFHRELSAIALSRGWLRLYVLWADGRPAAALYGFAFGGKFHFYQAGFDENFARLSVGLVTMGLAIREAFAEGLREYDMLHGDEAYKFLWARQTRGIERLEWSPPELRGAIYRTTTHTYRHARRFARRLLEAGRRVAGGSREVARARSPVVVPSAR